MKGEFEFEVIGMCNLDNNELEIKKIGIEAFWGDKELKVKCSHHYLIENILVNYYSYKL